MSRLLCASVVLAGLSGVAFAQWSTNPGANLPIGDKSGDQVQPKIKPTSDGGCYIAWFDNSTGGYDVYLQRLDVGGVEQWAHNGILLADRAVSSTVDYDMVVDAQDNAIVTYNDDGGVSGATQQISVQKISPSGQYLWGAHGVTLTTGTGSRNNPHVAALSDGNVMVGWSESPGFMMQKLDSAGTPVSTIHTISESGRTITLSDLQPSDNGSVIALWVRPFTTSFLSSKYLYTQKYDSSFNPLWAPTGTAVAVEVYAPQPNTSWPGGGGTYGAQGGSIQNGYFPTFIPDGAGGAVYGWYENAGPRNAYIQHVLANGTFRFGANGLSNANTGTNRIRIGAGLAYNAATQEYYLASPESDASPQQNYSTFVQKFDTAGNLLWGNTGTTIIPSNTGNQPSFVQCQVVGDKCVVLGIDSRSATTGVVFAAGVNNEDGSVAWSNLASSTVETKSRLTSTVSTAGFAMMAFGGGASGGASNVYAQNVRGDGTYGPLPTGCNADYNQDGGADTSDVIDLANDIASGTESFPPNSPDFNNDGSADLTDVLDLANVVAGGNCP